MIWNSIYWKTVASRIAQVFPIQCRHLSFWSISSIPQWASENTSNVTVLTTNTTMLKTWFLLSNSLYSCFFSLEEWRMSPAFLPESSSIIWKKKKNLSSTLFKKPSNSGWNFCCFTLAILSSFIWCYISRGPQPQFSFSRYVPDTVLKRQGFELKQWS